MIRLVLCIVAVVFGLSSPLPGQVAPAEQIRFIFDRPVVGVPVPHYTLQIRGDGTGSYKAELAVAGSTDTQTVERTLTFSPVTKDKAWEALRLLRSSHTPCASPMKNIANTGNKTLEYRDAEGEGACTYNYSENKGVMQLTELFLGIETTLEAGRALEMKHRFDRLGLDAEMISLTDNVDSGRAVALETIAPALRSIAADTDLIERVRLRAAKLLERTLNAP